MQGMWGCNLCALQAERAHEQALRHDHGPSAAPGSLQGTTATRWRSQNAANAVPASSSSDRPSWSRFSPCWPRPRLARRLAAVAAAQQLLSGCPQPVAGGRGAEQWQQLARAAQTPPSSSRRSSRSSPWTPARRPPPRGRRAACRCRCSPRPQPWPLLSHSPRSNGSAGARRAPPRRCHPACSDPPPPATTRPWCSRSHTRHSRPTATAATVIPLSAVSARIHAPCCMLLAARSHAPLNFAATCAAPPRALTPNPRPCNRHAEVLRNVNMVQMDTLSEEAIAMARARRSRERCGTARFLNPAAPCPCTAGASQLLPTCSLLVARLGEAWHALTSTICGWGTFT